MKKILSSKLPYLFLIVVPLILVSVWFKDGYILGAAEAEIPFYDLRKYGELTRWSWTDIKLGYVSSFIIASNPTWNFLSWIQSLGISGFLIQATFFYALFLSAGLGIYFLTKELFEDIHPLANLAGVFFYWFNPVSLANIWNRFLYNFMTLYALFPLALFLFIRGLRKKSYLYSLALAVLFLVFSYTFTSIVFIILIWFVFAYTTIFYSLVSKSTEESLFNVKFFFMTLVIFILFNLWWMLPAFNLFSTSSSASSVTADVFTREGNLYTLDIMSQKLGNTIDLIRFMHFGFYNGEGPLWVIVYESLIISLLVFTIPALILGTIIFLRKHISVLYLGILFILTIFLGKGSNPPFGEMFKFFFENFSILQVFRNPFEKFSFLLQLSAAPLIGYGVYRLARSRVIIFVTVLTGTVLTGVLGYPFLSGLTFTGVSYPNNNYEIGYKVDVPKYYREADSWLIKQGNNFRFVGFPLDGEGITYNWNKGYQGVELSNSLFSTPNILHNTSWPFYFQVVERLEKMLIREENFTQVLNLLNSRFIMLRSDINFDERGMRDPKSLEKILEEREKSGQLKKVAQFGKLSFWENLKWRDKTVYTAYNLIEVSPQAIVNDLLLRETGVDEAIYNKADFELDSKKRAKIIHPESETNPEFSLTSRTYKFNVSEEGSFEIVLENGDWTKEDIYKDLSLTIDDVLAFPSALIRDDGKVSYGNIHIKGGEHKLVFSIPAETNLIQAPDSVVINPNQIEAVFKINDFDPYLNYTGYFEFLIKGGPGFELSIEQDPKLNKRFPPRYWRFIQNDSRFPDIRPAQAIFQLSSNPETANLVFRSVNSEVALRNIKLSKLIDVEPVLIKHYDPVSPFPLPKIKYTKHNPASYSVEISGAQKPFILVLSQLYNPGWQAIFEDNNPVRNHLLVNTYANGWLIDRTGNFELKLEFVPQRLHDLGKVLSLVSILLTFGLFGVSIFYKGRKIWK